MPSHEFRPGSAGELAGKRALLLGGLGFIGLNLVPGLLRAGAQVEVVNRSLDPLALKWLDRHTGTADVGVRQADLRDLDALEDRLQDVDLVVNLAGESGSLMSERDPLADARANVLTHLALLDALRVLRRYPRVVFISSRLVYGITGAAVVNEAHPTHPTSLHGLHKLVVEHYHRLYWEHHRIPCTVLRLTNPYGAFQLPDRREYGVVNRFIMSALRGETIELFGGGKQLRDYVYAPDVAAAIILSLSDERAIGETFNVGAGASVSMREMAERITAAAGSGRVASVPWPEGYERVETGDFRCDVAHIERKLGWRPRTDIESGLRSTIACYREIFPEKTTRPQADRN